MKFVGFIIRETWGTRTEVYPLDSLKYFRYDDSPNCLDMTFEWSSRISKFSFELDELNNFIYDDFGLFLGNDEKLFHFHVDRTGSDSSEEE